MSPSSPGRSPFMNSRIPVTERRRSRTDRAVGYTTAQVLKTSGRTPITPDGRWPCRLGRRLRHNACHGAALLSANTCARRRAWHERQDVELCWSGVRDL
jgi:hypothetical protein